MPKSSKSNDCRQSMRETWAPKSDLTLVRVDFVFYSFDVLFVWFVPRNGPWNSMDSLLS